jgi:hypothetical protein
MKKLLLSVAFLLTYVVVLAQRPYCCITQGAEMEYSIFDSKGDRTVGSKSTVISASGSNGNYDIVMKTEAPGMPPMEVSTIIRGGNASVNMGGASVVIDGKIPFVPTRLAVGMELDCGTVTVKMMGIESTMVINSNKVIGREELTTDAGTFKCYIVEQQYQATAMGFKSKGVQRTWYARGVGMVKMETFDGKGRLAQTQLLTSFSR